MNDYFIRYINLPPTVRGLTACSDGFYNIYTNSALSLEEQEKTIQHELTHIERDDFYSDGTIETVEKMN